jgi:hypothetical protein
MRNSQWKSEALVSNVGHGLLRVFAPARACVGLLSYTPTYLSPNQISH